MTLSDGVCCDCLLSLAVGVQVRMHEDIVRACLQKMFYDYASCMHLKLSRQHIINWLHDTVTLTVATYKVTEMAFSDDFQWLILDRVTKLDGPDIGSGIYGRVYAVKYYGTVCAAKQIHDLLVNQVDEDQVEPVKESFMKACVQCSKLRHPNIVQFLGVYYPDDTNSRSQFPVIIMEKMDCSLAQTVKIHQNIPIHIKFSIVHDVAIGLCYLHSHNPPIVHCNLSPSNILLTAHYVAKISDLRVSKVTPARNNVTPAPKTLDFMSPESCMDNPIYGTPTDVFAFAGIILHTFNQEWPSPSNAHQCNSDTTTSLEVQRRKQHIDKLTGSAEILKLLVEKCLDDDPNVRPAIIPIGARIKINKDYHMKESTYNLITLFEETRKLKSEITVLNAQKTIS